MTSQELLLPPSSFPQPPCTWSVVVPSNMFDDATLGLWVGDSRSRRRRGERKRKKRKTVSGAEGEKGKGGRGG